MEKKAQTSQKTKKPLSRRKKILLIGIGLFLAIGAIALWKAESVTQSITTKGSFLGSVGKVLSPHENMLKGEEEGRINIALLGMRGKGDLHGGELADTIMVASIIRTNDDKKNPQWDVSLISVPRDLLVTTPDGGQSKINAVYFQGEKKGEGGGLTAMEQVLSDVLGQPIHYAIAINFKAFSDLVDALGGVEITRKTPFVEPVQFHEKKVCDGDAGGVFTVPTGDYEIKYKKDGRIKSKYPYCYNEQEECGGVFTVPAGTTNLNGEQALCYVRARATSSDFDRARRQQEVIGVLRKKAKQLGILGSLGKVNQLLKSLGHNVSMDIAPWELQRFYNLYATIGDKEVHVHKVLENSEEGLLYAPEQNQAFGYHLKPRGENYDRIHQLFSTILQ